MRARAFIKALRELVKLYGNLPIVGGYLHDDTPPRRISVLDADGCETSDPAQAVAFFVES